MYTTTQKFAPKKRRTRFIAIIRKKPAFIKMIKLFGRKQKYVTPHELFIDEFLY